MRGVKPMLSCASTLAFICRRNSTMWVRSFFTANMTLLELDKRCEACLLPTMAYLVRHVLVHVL